MAEHEGYKGCTIAVLSEYMCCMVGIQLRVWICHSRIRTKDRLIRPGGAYRTNVGFTDGARLSYRGTTISQNTTLISKVTSAHVQL
jgi:hypothetical protein